MVSTFKITILDHLLLLWSTKIAKHIIHTQFCIQRTLAVWYRDSVEILDIVDHNWWPISLSLRCYTWNCGLSIIVDMFLEARVFINRLAQFIYSDSYLSIIYLLCKILYLFWLFCFYLIIITSVFLVGMLAKALAE